MSDHAFRSQTISSFVNEFYRVFLWILDLSYSALSWKLTWCFFSCNLSGNAISGSLSFSNFIKFYIIRYGLPECKQCCL